jgi:hypothetical protein
MRKIWPEVTRKMAAEFETRAYAKVNAGERSVGAEKPQFSVHTRVVRKTQRRLILANSE